MTSSGRRANRRITQIGPYCLMLLKRSLSLKTRRDRLMKFESLARTLIATSLTLGCLSTYAASQAPVAAENGMVVTAQHLATHVGVDVLKNGGNAVDAAVAVGYALAVVYPAAGNLGGGWFHDPATGRWSQDVPGFPRKSPSGRYRQHVPGQGRQRRARAQYPRPPGGRRARHRVRHGTGVEQVRQ